MGAHCRSCNSVIGLKDILFTQFQSVCNDGAKIESAEEEEEEEVVEEEELFECTFTRVDYRKGMLREPSKWEDHLIHHFHNPIIKMASSITVSQEAYTTILLHCAKYPASAITGILVGTKNDQNAIISQAIPLQHHWNQLSPMIEVGLSLIQAHLSTEKLAILGVYFAPSDIASSTKSELNSLPFKVAQTISTKIGTDSIALQINNAKLADSKGDLHALSAYNVSSSAIQPKPISAQGAIKVGKGTSSATALAKAEIAKGRWQDLHDFDDHLEDTSRDWLKAVTA